MARQREIMVGSRDHFAVKIAFLTDPDQGLRRLSGKLRFLGCD